MAVLFRDFGPEDHGDLRVGLLSFKTNEFSGTQFPNLIPHRVPPKKNALHFFRHVSTYTHDRQAKKEAEKKKAEAEGREIEEEDEAKEVLQWKDFSIFLTS